MGRYARVTDNWYRFQKKSHHSVGRMAHDGLDHEREEVEAGIYLEFWVNVLSPARVASEAALCGIEVQEDFGTSR